MLTTIGLLGGTFDPVHKGHLLIAQQSKQLLNLAELHLIPCKANTIKQNFPIASDAHRFLS